MNKMDVLGRTGYTAFMDHYEKIWKLYRRYGLNVLEQDLEEEEKEVKEICLKSKNDSEFHYELTDLWEKNYKTIIECCADIETVYIQLDNPEITKINFYPVNQSVNRPRFYISDKFYFKLEEQKTYPYAYVMTEKFLYEIFLGKDINYYIQIKKKIPIASMLKDE